MNMSDAIITVSGLGKKYRISHQADRPRYTALRDVIANKVKGLLSSRKAKAGHGKSVEDFWALKDVSFEIKRGEVVGVIGRNGAGKSTLLKVLSRITEPSEGRVHLKGRVSSLLEVGTGFHPELTGRENIFLNGAILGMSRVEIRRKFDEIVAFAEVEKFLDTPVKRYSSGMYVRLAFAVAAHLEPEILIVDEVLAVGDAEFQKKCLGKMGDVAKGGRTVLFVSHNMAAITKLCSLGLLLHGGGIKLYGGTRQAVDAYHETTFRSSVEKLWPQRENAPGNNMVILRSVKVISPSISTDGIVDISKGCCIEIEYELLQTDRNRVPIAAIQLINENGTILFASADFDRERKQALTSGNGNCRAVCHIPGGLLAEGRFSVLVAMVNYNPNIVHALAAEAVSFEAAVVPEKIIGSEPITNWPGVVRPQLAWS